MGQDAFPIVAPVFVCGHGRSGTTLAARLLGVHPEVAWFSGWTNRFPGLPQLALASRLQRLPLLERSTRGLRRLPRPAEAYSIWDHFFPGFSAADRDWGADEVSTGAAEAFRRSVGAHLRYQGGSRFLTKYTGWPRFDFVRQLFPDARFVVCRRDPRAVVFSAMRQRWGYKSRPDELAAMSWRERLDVYVDWYLRLDAALARFSEGSDYESVRYEALVADVRGTMSRTCELLELPWSARYERAITSWPVRRQANEAWRGALGREERDYLEERLSGRPEPEA